MPTITPLIVNVEFDDNDFLDIVDTAGYGIAYWCEKAIIIDDEHYEVWYFDPDAEEDVMKATIITPDTLKEAYEDLINDTSIIGDRVRGYLLEPDIDAEAADCLIQMCCFGNIIFG